MESGERLSKIKITVGPWTAGPRQAGELSSTSDFIHADAGAACQLHVPLAIDGLAVGALPLESLDHHPAFRFGKVSFLMGAAVGFVNTSQNMIIQIFPAAGLAGAMVPPGSFTDGDWMP